MQNIKIQHKKHNNTYSLSYVTVRSRVPGRCRPVRTKADFYMTEHLAFVPTGFDLMGFPSGGN